MTYSFIFKDSFMDLTKTRIREIQTDEEVLLHPKWRFQLESIRFFLEKKKIRQYLQKNISYKTPLLCFNQTEKKLYELKICHFIRKNLFLKSFEWFIARTAFI